MLGMLRRTLLEWMHGVALCCMLLPTPASAALVDAPEATRPPGIMLAAFHPIVAPELGLNHATLQAASAGQPICGVGSPCQDIAQPADAAQFRFAPAPAMVGPFGRMTFLVNFALIALGSLWIMLTRRSLRGNRG